MQSMWAKFPMENLMAMENSTSTIAISWRVSSLMGDVREKVVLSNAMAATTKAISRIMWLMVMAPI